MAIVTDLNGCFVSESDIFCADEGEWDAELLLYCACAVNSGIMMMGVDSGFLFGDGEQMLDLMRKQYDAGYVNRVYFRNGQFHDCAEDEPALKHTHITSAWSGEVREMNGFKIGETVTFYRDESFAHMGVSENWNDGEDLKIIAFAHIWGKWLPVVQHAKKQQVSPIVFDCIKKKMTDAEIKARVIEELADNACEELFGCSIDECHVGVAETVRAMIEGDYRKQQTQEHARL